MTYKVAVIGGAGRVGLPFSLLNAISDDVDSIRIIDTNTDMLERIYNGEMPYLEEEGQELLDEVLAGGKISFSNKFVDFDPGVIVIMIGTPVDSEGNPVVKPLYYLAEKTLPHRIKGSLIILRSTVSPGTTQTFISILEDRSGLKEGKDFFVVFAPERVSQGRGIIETSELPQLIGASNQTSFNIADKYFSNVFGCEVVHGMEIIEAELGKLYTNMYRYVNFALANEFYMIGEKYGVDVQKVLAACNDEYPRMNCPMPGPNVSGPCLYKDGKFLVSGEPYCDLIKTSFEINEGMPKFLYNLMMEYTTKKIKKVVIWGAAFKANNDDIRNSLSFKMKKVLEAYNIKVFMLDPLVYTDIEHLQEFTNYWLDADAHIVMTPHSLFTESRDFEQIFLDLPQHTMIVDMWRMFAMSKTLGRDIWFKGEEEWPM